MTDSNAKNDTQPIWVPSKASQSSSNLIRFIKRINPPSPFADDYHQFHRWSLDHAERFWSELWEFCQVLGEKGDEVSCQGVSKWGAFTTNRDTQWFPKGTLNYAENLLSSVSRQPNAQAIYFENEQKQHRSLTWLQLEEQVSVVQQWLKDLGVSEGDVVAGYLPHLPETVVAMLATTSLGAIWTSTSPDFGAESVVERFSQVEPKVLFCCDGYRFNGSAFDMTAKNHKIADSIPSIDHICVIKYLHEHSPLPATKAAVCAWASIVQRYESAPLNYHRVAFNAPLFVLYSSGTTGKPKCIVHSVGGILLNHLKEHQLHCDIKNNDRVFYYTTCGWMMWNWHVSALASGATLVIFDGSPMYPSAKVLWELAEQQKVTLFGTAAKYLEALQKSTLVPCEAYPLSHLRTLCSTGSVLYPQQFDFVYQSIKPDLHLASISGGTDICGCFVLGNPISPVYRGECQGPGLGLAVKAFNQQGKSIVNQRGELVCVNSFPNQPIGFWGDDGERYHNAYWAEFDNVWNHGDDVLVTERGGMMFFGRSDATLNPGGVRIGTAEIYQQVNQLDEIKDSLAVGRTVDGDEKIVLFVQLNEGAMLDSDLVALIKRHLKHYCSPRHVPAEIHEISDIPKTKSGKLVELAVKQVLHGKEVKNKGAIANPQVLDEIAHYRFIDGTR